MEAKCSVVILTFVMPTSLPIGLAYLVVMRNEVN